MQETINIVMSADEAAIEQSATVIASAVKRSDRHFHVRCYLRNTTMKSFEKDRLKVEFISSESQLYGHNIPDHINQACYDRLSIIRDAKDWDKCILLDYDQLLQADIADLFDINIENHYLAARLSGTIEEMLPAWNLGTISKDVPRGIREAPWPWLGCVMNLKRMREHGIWQKLMALHKRWPITEQASLAMATAYEVKNIEKEWNFCPIFDGEMENPKIIHWTAPDKPWNSTHVWRPEIWHAETSSWDSLKRSLPDLHHQNSPVPTSPVLSVCVSLKNRSDVQHGDKQLHLFPNCVRSIAEAAQSVGAVELVVADYDSDDAPLATWFEEAVSGLSWQLITIEGSFSRGQGINKAVMAARSKNILICDADILVSGDALQQGISILQQGNVSFPLISLLDEQGQPNGWTDGYGICFVTKGLFKACGGLPEFKSWGGEDNLFHNRVSQMADVVRKEASGLRHQWHPEEYRHKHYSNQAVSDFNDYHSSPEKQLERYPVSIGSVEGNARVFLGEHPAWSGPIYLYPDLKLTRPYVDSGTYELTEKDSVTLKWDGWPAEELHWNEQEAAYIDQNKPFILRELVSI